MDRHCYGGGSVRVTDAALLILTLMVAWSIYRANRDPGNTFNFLDLLMENGRISKLACVFLGSFIVTSWVMIRLTFDGKMDGLLFAAYGALWVTPITAKLFSLPPKDQ